MATTETLVVTAEHTTLDLLLWRRFRTEVAGRLEATLALNPGLAGLGAVLPVGTRVLVTLPVTSGRRASVPARKVVRLFD